MDLRRAIIIGLVLGHALGLTLSPGRARAQVSGMVISQLQAGGAGSGHAGDEFVELYNNSSMPRSLDKWSLQYRASTATGDCTQGWSTKLTLPVGVVVAPQTFWLAAATGYLITADGRFAAGFASTKATVRLIDTAGQVIDALAWGGASCGMGASVAAPPDGQSLERSLGGYSGNNLSDFALQTTPQPHSSVTVIAAPMSYPSLEFTEVLVKPVTAAKDAYVELHNPNSAPVQVSAYGLVVDGVIYHLAPAVLAPDGYLAFTTAVTGLAPNASGGQVSLLDPAGITIDRSDVWAAATPGRAWALSDGGWLWTDTPTSGSANQFPPVTVTDPPPNPVVIAPTLSIELSELLPNPSAVLNGDLEKYVELHNTGVNDVVLDGYSLRSGANLGNHEPIPHLLIKAGSYLALPFSLTRLSLAVDGSKVGLFDPSGNLLGETVSYGKAPSGQAYARFSDGWHWTTLPTPAATNVMVSSPITTATAKAAKTTKVSTKMIKVVKAKRPASVLKQKVAKAKLVKASPAVFATTVNPPNGRWLLFILAGLTIVYISYEFRLDLQHYYYRCRRYIASRRKTGEDPQDVDDSGTDQ
jgi:hypothetical protein